MGKAAGMPKKMRGENENRSNNKKRAPEGAR
jgi:hypothetical protein